MYADNKKISLRQLKRLYIFDFLGVGTLLLPTVLAQGNGIFGFVGLVLGVIFGVIYLGFLLPKKGFDAGKLWQSCRLFPGMVCLHCVLTAGYIAYLFCDLMRYSLMTEGDMVLPLAATLLITGYSVKGGVENRARIYEVLFWVILIPLIIMLVFGARDIRLDYYELGMPKVQGGIPLDGESWKEILGKSYLVFLIFTPVVFLPLLYQNITIKRERSVQKTVRKAIFVTGLLLILAYGILLGNYGNQSLITMKYPIITLMNTVQIEGTFVKRTDALMLGVWFFTLLALLNLHIHFGVESLKGKEKDTRYWKLLLVVGVVFCLVMAMEYDPILVEWFKTYYFALFGPLCLLVPFGIWVIRRGSNKKKALLMGMGIVASFYLTSCGGVELEEKWFPMSIVVDYVPEEDKFIFETGMGETVEAAKEDFEESLNKVADYNHLKVFFLGKRLLDEKGALEEVLITLSQLQEIPRNTYLCTTDSPERLQQGDFKPDLGTYVEEFLKTQMPDRRSLPTLGTGIDAFYNKKGELYLPILLQEEGVLLWEKNYYLTFE
ncbi:MAG: GerAB/ArcD/ProY family transporter [Agathobacter sp.]|nr:GerAB/ArcD/ProY family transporter [Agathobacter sp.]